MASAIPFYNSNHTTRHSHVVAPTNLTPTSSSTSTCYYPSSSTSTQRSSYWSNGPSSVSTTSSTTSPRFNAGLTTAQYVTKHTTGRLHKRARPGSKTPPEGMQDEPFDEGFFSGPGSPPSSEPVFVKIKSKAKIKPLLKKVSGSSRNNSLDLSRSDGGLPHGIVGLGIYDSQGYDSSGVDDDAIETAFPKHPRKHSLTNQRNFSGRSSVIINSPLIPSTNPIQSFAHPKRQIPRRRGPYTTPDMSCNGTSNESSDESSDELETRRIVLSGSNRSPSALRVNTSVGGSGYSTPIMNSATGGTSMTDLHSYVRARASSGHLASPTIPISPLDTNFNLKQPRRKLSASSASDRNVREYSPSFAASVAAARLAWEAKEEKKEEKRERKRRRSEAKEEERCRTISRNSFRIRGNSDSTEQNLGGGLWDENEEGYREKDGMIEDDMTNNGQDVFIGVQYSATTEKPFPEPEENPRGRQTKPTGMKWGGVPSADQGRNKGSRLKKHWLGFIVWVRIGMVRLGRTMGF